MRPLSFAPIVSGYLFERCNATVVRRLGKGVKSSKRDKGEGTKDMLKGVAKEATGALRGDDTKRAKGLSDQRKGASRGKRVS